MITKNKNGDIFLELIECNESEGMLYKPTHSLIVVKHDGKDLLMFNSWRKQWEIAGGILEKDESLRECAIRELEEETNQQAENVQFVGMMKFQLKPDDRVEYGALYSGEITKLNEFIVNDEANEIIFWDGKEDIGYINEIDEKLLSYWKA